MSGALVERLLTAARRAPLTWAAYMEAALYDAEHGYFAHASRAGAGPATGFTTAPHLSPVFAALVAEQVREAVATIGAPSVFVDLGAGDGALAGAVADAIGIDVLAVDRSPAARAAIAGRGLRAAGALTGPLTGVVVANELFDNIPFHRIRRVRGALREVVVAAGDGRLVEALADPTPEALVALSHEPAEGQERTASPAARAMVTSIAHALERGYALLIDYGTTGDEPPEAVRGYAEHRSVADLLAAPGTTDLTGPVDFDGLADAARAAGLQVWGPVSQREALMRLGYRRVLEDLRARQRKDEAAGRWPEAIGAFGARGEASMLVDEAGLGSFKVLALGTAGLPPPRAVADTA